ncbi:DUF465 domain-containing protein [Pseudomonas sp. dw_358]|uniref:DUF465 domain-containing protein n=1 Tax=Pseudomonas sp. dw_358 TaxID=2720083 RepID=UPI001BD6B6A4|nr:DUF465 domain-containing protein [Pseudomonas sp. dw_358]
MPVKHNLFEDLNVTKADVEKRRQSDEKLSRLLDEYQTADGAVVDAEAAAAHDDEVKKLKEKRLLIKDKIVQQWQYPDTQGAGTGKF